MLYGVDPIGRQLGLKPVMALRTVISHVHPLLPGESVSYGGTYIADTPKTLATLPLGYADGFVRAYGGFGVTVNTELGNFKAPIVGRICMDQCMIDVTGIPVKVGDQVTIFGDDPRDLSELARRAGTIEYECLALVSARVPRVTKIKRESLNNEKERGE
jgi:alanine racemase